MAPIAQDRDPEFARQPTSWADQAPSSWIGASRALAVRDVWRHPASRIRKSWPAASIGSPRRVQPKIQLVCGRGCPARELHARRCPEYPSFPAPRLVSAGSNRNIGASLAWTPRGPAVQAAGALISRSLPARESGLAPTHRPAAGLDHRLVRAAWNAGIAPIAGARARPPCAICSRAGSIVLPLLC